MAGISDAAKQEKLIQAALSSSMNSAPKKSIPKKQMLPQGHYTREFLLSNHERMLGNQHMVGRAIGTTTHDLISSSKQTIFGKQDLKKYENSYTPIKIRDLAPGVINGERIVYAKTIVESANMASLHTVIQDESEGGGTCKLCIYNLTQENARQFGKDTKLAILHPYYKKAADNMHLMRVDNPMEIIIIPPDAPGAMAPSLLPIQHKELGNKLFQEGKLTEALEEYNQAIMGDRHDPIFYSNRSLCHTRLRQFEAALSDATAAADINLDDPKFKYRACMAWSGLGNHRKAIDILKVLVLTAKDNTSTLEFQNKLSIENTYLAQQRGVFNLKGIEDLVLAGLPIQMADYIGPLELKKSDMTGCAERGLFATRDIQRGEIFHVSKAAVFLNNFKPEISNVMELSSNSVSPPFQILVSKLIQEMNKSRLVAHRALCIVEDKKFSRRSPFYTNIDLYTDKGYDLIKDMPSPEFSIDNIRYITTKKGFSTVLKGISNATDVSDREYNLASGAMNYGLWFIPSLLNHSCVGNVVRVVKGEVCLLKVFKDVKAGEELLFSSFDGTYSMPLNERKKSLMTLHGYVCNCVLCKYENEPNITPLISQANKLYYLVKEFWTKYGCNSRTRLPSRPPIAKYREYFSRGIELAEALGLGPQTFCGPIWSAFIYLTCITNVDAEKELYFHEKIQKYLSELEVYHQHSYWMNYFQYCLENFGPTHPKYIRAMGNYEKFQKLFYWE